MALKASSISATTTPVLVARGLNEHHKVRLQASAGCLVGGTAAACTYPVPTYADVSTTEFMVTLDYAEELWLKAATTATVKVLQAHI